MRTARLPRKPRSSERGAFGVLYAIMLPVMLGMIGLAVDLSMVYARGHELQAIADAAALAAARALNGTDTGITAAKQNARSTARLSVYRFLNGETIEWSHAALSFGPTAQGPWTSAEATIGAADAVNLRFARVDTTGLDEAYGQVAVTFLSVVGVDVHQSLSRRAVAGRKDTALAPLAVCALKSEEKSGRSNAPYVGYEELLEYGFRRGVGYNLLDIGPGTAAKNYVVNPVDFPPALSLPAHLDDAAVRPFVCTAAMPAPLITNGSTLYVREGFPASLAPELNSRFGNYTGGSVCTKYGAPPDANIIDFRGGYPLFWMTNGTSALLRGSALPLGESSAGSGARKITIADADAIPSNTVAAHYGPLWAFAKPLRYNSATGVVGAAFAKGDWSKLYQVSMGAQLSSTYSKALPPYDLNIDPYKLSPAPLEGVPRRRVLNVPLLECPVSGATARVLGIGRFMLTSAATSSPAAIHAEFGGLVDYNALTASAVLYQ